MKKPGLIIICFCFVSATLAAVGRYDVQGEKDESWKPGAAQTGDQGIGKFNKASALIGMDVKNPENEGLGSIKDLMVDMQSGRIIYAVLSSGGGILGVGDKLMALPVTALSQSSDSKFLILDADREAIRSASGFNSDDWPTVANNRWRVEASARLSERPALRTEIRESAGSERRSSAAASSGESSGWVPGKQTRDQTGVEPYSNNKSAAAPERRFVKASDFIGMNVKNLQGEKLGEIEDVALDLQSGRILYAALSSGGFLGIRDRLFAVPIEVLRRSSEANMLTLDVSADALRSTPGFVKNNWPEKADVHFYGKGISFQEKAGAEKSEFKTDVTTPKPTIAPLDRNVRDQIRESVRKDTTLSSTAKKVRITVNKGKVTLTGTVADKYEHQRVISTAEALVGSENVYDQIIVTDPRQEEP